MTDSISSPMQQQSFDAAWYMRTYPDVALSGLTPQEHYEKYGRLMKRAATPEGAGFEGDASTSPLRFDVSKPEIMDALYAQGPIGSSARIRHPELVSIIIPSYNNEKWLRRAINAARSQRGVNVEIIVVDDGSTDASVSVARQIAAAADNVKVLSLLRNFGCYYARNSGVRAARGAFITILDSDDIMSPDRIARQLDALKSKAGAMATRCNQRRWSSDFRRPLGKMKLGENSLLWRRELVDHIGYYDSVRFGGDSEFRLRIQRTFGTDSVVNTADELYFLRTLESSLTTNAEGGVFKLIGESLEVSIAPERTAYEKEFTAWQKAGRTGDQGGAAGLRIDFPQTSRRFPLGGKIQNASPSLGQLRIGAMASFPPRRFSLEKVVSSVLPQLDQLIIYLNGYEDVPKFLDHPKIRVVRNQDSLGDLRDNGKFFDLPDHDAYIFTLDDDLRYPSDYVATLIHQIEMLGRSSIVGVHGVIFPMDNFINLRQRTVFQFSDAHDGHFVDLLGTGTAAWHTSTLRVTLEDFSTKGVCDLWFAAAAAKKGVPLFSVSRGKNWLSSTEKFEESLYREAVNQPQGYFEIFEGVLKPILETNKIRHMMEGHLARGFDCDTLQSAGIILREVAQSHIGHLETRRIVTSADPSGSVRQSPSNELSEELIHFHLIVNGWNCSRYLDDCARSIAHQLPGPYTYDVTFVEDGSSDGTAEKIARSAILPDANLIRIIENAGPAYARHIGISSVRDPNTVVVTVDMDDALEPQALRTVAQRYRENRQCLMTIGNWHDQRGRLNPQPFYSPEEINKQTIREVEMFNATQLRTFRRWLYDAISEDDLRDQHGAWLETCTDVALMYPLIDQCWSWELEFISEPIYRYNRQHSTGTLARFGKPHKVERLAWLKSKAPKARASRLPIGDAAM